MHLHHEQAQDLSERHILTASQVGKAEELLGAAAAAPQRLCWNSATNPGLWIHSQPACRSWQQTPRGTGHMQLLPGLLLPFSPSPSLSPPLLAPPGPLPVQEREAALIAVRVCMWQATASS